MPEAVIVSALRTPIGTARKGTLRDTSAFDLAHHVVGAAAVDHRRCPLPSGAMDVIDLIAKARNGSPRAAGRLLSLVESDRRGEVLAGIGPADPGRAVRVIGITGPPGAGKSTTIAALVGAYRERGCRVAVLAVDPSSPFSGGALLGDRIRMTAHINDSDVLIRSVASRGHLGGLAAAVPAAIRLLGAIGYDVVLLETVGVGQSEIEIAAVADPTVVILNPGAGDAVQAAKAGLLEVADIVAVNKADRDGAEQTVRDLRAETKAPIVSLVAARGEGLADLVAAIVQKQIGQTAIPVYNVANACATGATALRTVIMAVKAGEADYGLAVGGEVGRRGSAGRRRAEARRQDVDTQGPPRGGGSNDGRIGTDTMPGVFAQIGMQYLNEHPYDVCRSNSLRRSARRTTSTRHSIRWRPTPRQCPPSRS